MTPARFATPALALATVALAAIILFGDLDGEGLVDRPTTPVGKARLPWQPIREEPEPEPPAVTWPATPEGLTKALAATDDALDACHAEWTRTDPGAPVEAIAVVRLARRPDGTARAVEVALEEPVAGSTRMEACARSALSGLVFTEPPENDLLVRFALILDGHP